MSTTATARGTAEPAVRTIDWVMVGLALVSIGLLLYVVLVDVSTQVEQRVYYIDTAICAVFAIEFISRWRREGGGWRFAAKRWYEILGMIPVAHPALRSLRLFRVVVLVIRLVRASDRVFGAGFTYRLVARFTEPIVLAIKKPITVAVLDEVVDVLETGNYPKNIANSLEANREELRGIISEKLREDQFAGSLKRLPFHDEVVSSVVDTAFRVVLEVLRDDRVDDFIAGVVDENRAQIRESVKLGLHEKPHS